MLTSDPNEEPVDRPVPVPEDSTEYLQDLNGRNQEVAWERAQEAAAPSDAQIEAEAELAMDARWEQEEALRERPGQPGERR